MFGALLLVCIYRPPPPPRFFLRWCSQNPENGINVLSKFAYVPGDTAGTYESEEVLVVTSEKASSVHSSGWVGFAPSSYGAKEVSE